MLAVLATASLPLAAAPAPKPAATTTPAPQRHDLRLTAALTARGLAPDQQAPVKAALESFASTVVNGGSGFVNAFSACVVGSKLVPCPTDLASIDVLVTTAVGALDKKGNEQITLTAGSLVDNRQTGQLTFTASDVAKGGLADALKHQSDEQLRQLLGTPVMANGALTLTAYSPFLQLVPETATDRKYLDMLAHYLALRRIQTVPSPFTGLDASGAGTSAATGVCQNSPRFLHYTVSSRQSPRPLQFRTVVYAQGTGQIIDCADPAAPLAFHAFTPMSVTSSKSTMSSIIGILTLSFISKTNSWGNTAAVGNSLGGFIDVDPTSSTVEQSVYNAALRSLVDDMCVSLARYKAQREAQANSRPGVATTPTPTPAPDARVAGTPDTTSQAAAAGTAATNALGVGNLLVPSQPPLECAAPVPQSSNQ